MSSRYREFSPSGAGEWTSQDGEYVAMRAGRGYAVYHVAHWNALTREHERLCIGQVRTLSDASRLAAVHRVQPVQTTAHQQAAPRFKCSGDVPGGHVDCAFTCETEDDAFTHFEKTSHSVDEVCPTGPAQTTAHQYRVRTAVFAAGQYAEASHVVRAIGPLEAAQEVRSHYPAHFSVSVRDVEEMTD